MEMIDLIRSLKDQHQFLETFLNTIMLQQKAIIENDMTGLEETLKTEGALMIYIEQHEKKVLEIISELSKKYSIKVPSKKLSDFVNVLKTKRDIEVGTLDKIQISLKKLILKIAQVNTQNKILIEQARNFVQETISSIISLNKNQILDRKI